MQYPLSEIYDRLSIELLKRERAGADNIAIIQEYFQEITGTIEFSLLSALFVANGRIWDLESDIRRGKEGELGLEEVGRRALAIRDINADRIQLKATLATMFAEHIDKKYNHASE